MTDDFYRVMHRVYLRDGGITYTDEAAMLAALVHTTGAGRKSKDLHDLQKIMKDPNLDD